MTCLWFKDGISLRALEVAKELREEISNREDDKFKGLNKRHQ